MPPHTRQAAPSRAALWADITGPGTPLAAISAWKDEPSDPNVTDQACPSDGATTAVTGSKPKPSRIGAVTTTGTPNPPTPCRKEAKAQPIRSACMPRSGVSRANPAATLKKGDRPPADQRALHAAIRRQPGQGRRQSGDASRLIDDAVQQEGR